VAPERDAARLRIARAGLTQTAVERVSRTCLARMPITLVDRARSQLCSFFSDAPWTFEDDAALAGLVGHGSGWTEEELAPGIRLSYGWRSSTFRIEIAADPALDPTGASASASATTDPAQPERTLGDTFEDLVLVEPGRGPAEVRFVTGPGMIGRAGRFTRADQGSSAAVAALFRDFDDIDEVRVEPGSVSVVLSDANRWPEVLLDAFDAVTAGFVPPRVAPTDRKQERAVAEIGSLDVSSPRDLARLLDATSSPDAAFRSVAVGRLELVDPALVATPWTRALEDSSRAVRRSAIRAMSHAARPELRTQYERALGDKDACVRYYALRGLAQIGVGRAEPRVDHHHNDDDLRVRFAARAALAGRLPR
jgi:hypothetical protein